MRDIIISFDSEDYLTPEAADAEKWWADALAARSIRGCWQLVGELVRCLERTGRTDVIDSLRAHEVDFHSDYHSKPPTHPEAVCGMSLEKGVAYVLGTEAPGLATLASTFNTWPVSYCSPGDSWTPATLLAMAQMGLKVFCNDALPFSGTPYWYCGLLVTRYHMDFQYFYEAETYEDGAFEDAFQKLYDKTEEDAPIVLYTHPTRIVTSRFWDEVFADGKRPKREDWHPAPLRNDKDIAAIKERCSRFLDYLKSRDDLRFIDYATLYHERAASRRSLQDLLTETGTSPKQPGQLPLRDTTDTFIPSNAFDQLKYNWLPYPTDFDGKPLVEQGRRLAWTASPATKAK